MTDTEAPMRPVLLVAALALVAGTARADGGDLRPPMPFDAPLDAPVVAPAPPSVTPPRSDQPDTVTALPLDAGPAAQPVVPEKKHETEAAPEEVGGARDA